MAVRGRAAATAATGACALKLAVIFGTTATAEANAALEAAPDVVLGTKIRAIGRGLGSGTFEAVASFAARELSPPPTVRLIASIDDEAKPTILRNAAARGRKAVTAFLDLANHSVA